jgi:two-component system NarL family sensor kinase
VINAIAKALNSSVDIDGALQAVLAHVANLLDLETGWIWLLNEETEDPYLAAAQNLPPALIHRPERMEGPCYCLDTFRAGDLSGAANVNVITCSRLKSLVVDTDDLRYHASIPLYAHGKPLGVLNVASRDWRQLSEDDLRLLHTVGDLLGIATERARLFSRSEELGAANERNRLAREIHDTLAQGLSAIALQLEAADALLDGGEELGRIQVAIRDALRLTRANLEEARRSVMDMRAAPLDGRELSEALAALIAEVNKGQQTQVDFEYIGRYRPLRAALEIGIYRLVQEALANIARHAGARSATVRLAMEPDVIRLTVEDDGRGFDTDHVVRNRFGLLGMNERVRLLGGTLYVESTPGTLCVSW